MKHVIRVKGLVLFVACFSGCAELMWSVIGILEDWDVSTGVLIEEVDSRELIVVGESNPGESSNVFVVRLSQTGRVQRTDSFRLQYYSPLVQQCCVVRENGGLFVTYGSTAALRGSDGSTEWVVEQFESPDIGLYGAYQSSDDGYIVVGQSEEDFFAAGLGSSGAVEWEWRFGGSSGESLVSVTDVSDGYAVAGTTASPDISTEINDRDEVVYAARLTLVGTLDWDVVYPGLDRNSVDSVRATYDDGFVVRGHSFSNGNEADRLFLWKIGADGTTLWIRTFSDESGAYATVAETLDYGYVVCGRAVGYDGNPEASGYVEKIDENGETEWVWPAPAPVNIKSVRQTIDGSYVVLGIGSASELDDTTDISLTTGDTGFEGYGWYVAIIDSTGNLLRHSVYGIEELLKKQFVIEWADATSIIQTTDGGFAILGGIGANKGLIFRRSCIVIKLDPSGLVEWFQTYGAIDPFLPDSALRPAG